MSIQSSPIEHLQFDPAMYQSKLPALLDIAAAGFGVRPTTVEQGYWRSISLVARAVDNYVDSELPVNIDTEVDQVLTGEPIAGLHTDQALRFAQLFAASSDRVRSNTEAALRLLPDFAYRGGLAANMKQYTEVRLGEAVLFAGLLQIEEHHNPHRAVYNAWTAATARAGYLADSLLDLGRDKRSGRLSFSPTVRERAWLASLAATESVRAITMTPPQARATLTRAAISTLKKKS